MKQDIVISVQNISKIYDEKTIPVIALQDVSFEIEKGEFIAIKGPSGSGKTTLLNLLGGLDKPSHGNIQIGGHEVSSLSGKALVEFRLNHIGFVFQSYNLIPVFTAAENIGFIMQLQKINHDLIHKRVQELLIQIGLTDKANKRPFELSGGQQQRIAVARALAGKPQFILADEPTANLDSKTAFHLLDLMLELNQKEQMTFIFSTHDQRVIERARRIITLEDGRIVSDQRGIYHAL